jgi:uncharacterized protein (DUF2062 family)
VSQALETTMTTFFECTAYMPHLKAMLVCAVLLGMAIGGMATAIVLAARN